MNLKKTIAALAVTSSIAAAGVASTGTAWASTCSGSSCWHIYSTYSDYSVCYAEGISLIINGEFGGPFIDFKCVGDSEGFWDLWVETNF